MSEEPNRPFRLFSYADDQPSVHPGALIPPVAKKPVTPMQKPNFHPLGVDRTLNTYSWVGWSFSVVALFALLVVGTAGYGVVAQSSQVATPAITLIDPYTDEKTVLEPGPQPLLEKNSFFLETREALIEEGVSFIDVDRVSNQLRFFKQGVLVISAEIEALAEPESWRNVPAGLYEVDSLEKRTFSNLAQVYLPNNVRFGGNYSIHGVPEYPDGTAVPDHLHVDGIRIANDLAAHLFSLTAESMLVLVHTAPKEVSSFIYESSVENVTAPQYLVADIETGTILVAKNVTNIVPIASVTKLMTAVVAIEEISLDSQIPVVAPTLVESLVPRLKDRSRISMHGLLQLLLIESSNEAAEVIAAQLVREKFITAMNKKAAVLGLSNTVFTDPSGLDSGNVSSVQDLYTLVQRIYQNHPFIFTVTKSNEPMVTTGTEEYTDLINFNQLENIESFVGGKVGETNAAGQTSVSLHEVVVQDESRTIVVIVLGSADRINDVTALLEHVNTTFGE